MLYFPRLYGTSSHLPFDLSHMQSTTFHRHPAFEEDEILLIALGGVLGAIVGGIQWAVFP